MRYFIELAYNGKEYHGWQFQPDAVTVQETLEISLQTLLQAETPVVGAGRTDAGVHASRYFAHFDVENTIEEASLVYKLNSVLPEDIAVYRIREVSPEAHARFDALSRSYEYRITQQKDPFELETAHYVKNRLNVEKMNEAAAVLGDYRDFKCFSRSRTDVKTYNCDLMEAFWEEQNEKLIFHIKADRFLRNMVRAVVGTLLQVGLGKMPVEEMHTIIKSRDRKKAGASVPAKGLFLTDIKYPETIFKE